MTVTIASPASDSTTTVDAYDEFDDFLADYVEQLAAEADGDVTVDGPANGFYDVKYTEAATGDDKHLSLLVLEGGPDDDPVVAPFDFSD